MPAPFENDTDARALLEALRWPDGPCCPHCGSGGSEVILIGGEKHSHRAGLYQCRTCRRQFSVTVGTFLERLRMPLRTLVCAARAFGEPYATRPTLVELATQIRVNYRTVLRMRDIIKRVAKSYRGYQTPFGAWPRVFMKSWATTVMQGDVQAASRFSARRASMREKGTHPEQHTVKSGGILADMVSAEKRERTAMDRTEALLRLLLATPKKKSPPKRKRKKPIRGRGRGPSGAQRPTARSS